jgi:DNA-binding IclR family transcriptional regulator
MPVNHSPDTEILAADRVLHLLTVLARAPRALSAAELMLASGLPRSALYRQLARLRRFDLVLEQGGLYAPGPLCLQLAVGFERSSSLVHTARPFLAQLSQLTQESAGLIVVSDGQAMCLAMAESSQSLRCSFAEGRSVPLQRGASALCLLAHLPTAQREAVLQQHYAHDLPARAQAQARLQAIRDAGYVITLGEVDAGVWGCSVPLFGAGRRAIAALTLMAPEQRVQTQQAQWIQQTLTAAARISRALTE